MTARSIRTTPLLKMGALPPNLRDLTQNLPPRICFDSVEAGPLNPAPTITVQAPQSVLGLHPCIALPSAAANTRVED